MNRKFHVPLIEMSMCLSNAMDLVSPHVVDHHKRVAYIATSIGKEMGLSEEAQEDLMMAGLLHDIGAISLQDRLDALKFEIDHPHIHAELGYRLIKSFPQFSRISQLVRFHHLAWNNGEGESFDNEHIPLTCHILHIADRIAAMVKMQREVLDQSQSIFDKIRSGTGKKFVPLLVNVFSSISQRENFWFDVVSPSITNILTVRSKHITLELDLDGLLDLSGLFSKIIDFRSRFTATHSSGVAATAKALGKLTGLSRQECRMLRIAGYLHDIGKLAVPAEILEKPAKLTREELHIVKKHTYDTYWTLSAVKNLEEINTWASLHHECLDGRGYPFHLTARDIPAGSRIVAVADVFTALTEDRPYRSGMSRQDALGTLEQMAAENALDGDIVSTLVRNYDEVNSIRLAMQAEESADYASFRLN